MAEIGIRHSRQGCGFMARLGRWEAGLGWADHWGFPWSDGYDRRSSTGRGLWIPVGRGRALYLTRDW